MGAIEVLPHHDFIPMPDISTRWTLAAKAAGVVRSKFHGPPPDRFIGNHNLAFQQHLFGQPEAQREPAVEPHRMSDDLDGKPLVLGADKGIRHSAPNTGPEFQSLLT
jgi:hypothetical protein